LLIQQAEKLGISLSDAQIEQMLAQQPSLQENGQFSQKLYENYLRSIGMTSEGLIASTSRSRFKNVDFNFCRLFFSE
jgi:peptidyl-prolyl cis-trans isomerase D